MKLQRRRFLHLAAGAAALPALPRFALALDYPTRPVRIVVPYPAGIAPDIVARVVAQPLSQRLKRQFIVATGRAAPAMSAPRWSPALRPTAIRSWS